MPSDRYLSLGDPFDGSNIKNKTLNFQNSMKYSLQYAFQIGINNTEA